MIYPRQTFCFFAILFLIGLGTFAFFQNPRSKLNRLFALYNLCNLLWNSNDFVIFFSDQTAGLWFYRFGGIGGCLIGPTLLHFIYIAVQISENKIGKAIIRTSYAIGILLAIFALTPLVAAGVLYEPFKPSLTEIPGPLYPVFSVFFLSVLILTGAPIPYLLTKRVGIKRLQLIYILLAIIAGLIALSTYFLSFAGHDWPWVYYPMQALASFLYAYAIFKYDLIPGQLALRRAMLLLGIYIAMAMALIPTISWFYRLTSQGSTSLPIETIIIFVFVVGIIFSMGPMVYSSMVRHLSLFQDSVASQITHEFKTPLAAIQGAREVLEDAIQGGDKDPRKIRDYMAIIERNTARLQKFVAEVLDFNRIKEISGDGELEKFDLKVIYSEVLQDFLNRRSSLTFECKADATMLGSKEGMKQVFSNLLSNAVKFCPNGKIDVLIAKEEGRLQISVQDEGVGIPKPNLDHIFDPFFKTASPNHTQGSGLGLAIVKKWIEFHHGTIWVESEGEGRGTKVMFTLPIN